MPRLKENGQLEKKMATYADDRRATSGAGLLVGAQREGGAFYGAGPQTDPPGG